MLNKVKSRLSYSGKKGILVFVMLLMAGAGFGQVTFQKTYSDSITYGGKSVEQTTDGGYIIGGTTYIDSTKAYDFYIIKTNTNGDTTWTKILGTTAADNLINVHQTTDGGYIIGGSGSGKILVIKMNIGGTISWAKAIGGFTGASANCIKQTSDGGYIIGGYTYNFGNGIYLVKMSSTGTVSWGKTFYGTDALQLYSLEQTADGGYVISGIDYNGTNAPYIIKTSNTGALSWAKTYSYLYPDFIQSYTSVQTTDGGYMLAGSYHTGGMGNYLSLFKTDATGNLTWAKGYDLTGGVFPYGLQQTTDGGYVITGSIQLTGDTATNVFLLKTVSNGNVSWTKWYGSSRNEFPSSVQQTADGGCIVSGTLWHSGVNSNSIYIIKTNSSGSSGCLEGTITASNFAITPIVNSFAQSSLSGDTVSTPIITSARGGLVGNACLVGGINELSNPSSITLYPNPTINSLTIAFGKNIKKAVVTITDITGKLIYTTTASETEKMEVSTKDYAEGVYIVKFQTEDGVEMKKLIVQK